MKTQFKLSALSLLIAASLCASNNGFAKRINPELQAAEHDPMLSTPLPLEENLPPPAPKYYGLYAAQDFKISTGKCTDCASIPQSLWYFENETIATPTTGLTDFKASLQAQTDVQQWLETRPNNLLTPPSLIWTGETEQLNGELSADGAFINISYGKIPLKLVPKLASNQSYYNAASTQFFANQPLSAFGKQTADGFVAHTLWPQNFSLNANNTPFAPLEANETIASLVRAQVGGAQTQFKARLLWQRNSQSTWQNKPVLAFVLNGAQGDDDEAHGGHFAIATGRFGAQGEWDNWLVNNFYNLGSVSEKGIIAASVPMSRYQAELNSGQSWYRPSYMLVAVLKDEKSAAIYQSAINRVFNHFYRQDFLYRHAGVNCAGINVETLRSIGWQVPKQGATSLAKAFAALPYKAISDKSLDKGLLAFDYLAAEQTNLYPFVAFETIGQDLLQRIAKGQGTSPFEQQLAENLEAIIYVDIPQFPSSRAFGQAPVASLDEYMARVPEDFSKWKVIPVGTRELPAQLKDKNAVGEPVRPALWGALVWAVLLLLAGYWLIKRKQKRVKKA